MSHVVKNKARLAYVELCSPDPAALSKFYQDVFSADVEKIGNMHICRGPERCLIIVPGQSKTLNSAGYSVLSSNDIDDLIERLSIAGIHNERTSTPIFTDAVGFTDLSGNKMFFGVPQGKNAIVSGLPGRIQHLVVASRNAKEMVDFYTRIIGMVESDRVLDKNGVLRTAFMRSDDEHHSFAVFQAGENRLDHHCYEATNWNSIRDWADHFASLNIPVKWGPGRHGPGNNLFVFVHDTDGNWVEISAEIEVIGVNRKSGVWPHEERTLNSWGSAPLRS
jgi:catechol 2,3-dioxygenase-like lactoylglutathione lyase family enzyme